MNIPLDEFVNAVKDGKEGPGKPCIRRNMRGDQVFHVPFSKVCNGYCKKHDIYPLSLYTMIQQAICDDMVKRSQRSSLFRNIIQKVSDDWGYKDVFIPDIFTCDNVNFDEGNLKSEKEVMDAILSQYEDLNKDIEEGVDDEKNMYERIMNIRKDTDNSIERNRKFAQELEMGDSHEEPNIRMWTDLSTYMKPDYLESFDEDSNDSNIIRYANKKVNREIPDEMPDIFSNLTLLQTLKLKKCEELKRELYSNIENLQELLQNCDDVLSTLPEPIDNDSKPWVWKFLGIGGDVSEDESDAEYSEEEDPAVELKQALDKLETSASPGDIMVTEEDDETIPDEEYKLELNIDDGDVLDEDNEESINPQIHSKSNIEFY